ncbi:MAG TPA: DNA polymerase [Candidatus Paceibacterota bacterium]
MSKTDQPKASKGKKAKGDRKLLVLLDSHAIIHRAYHALPDFASSKGKPTGALYGLSTMLFSLIEKFKPDYIVACYDLPQPTYRHEAYEGYKAGRKKTDDALVEQLVSSREIFTACGIPMYDMPGFEADDMLGTIVHQVTDNKDFENVDVLIASGDMDTLQLIQGDRVRVFTLKKGIKDTVVYDEEAVRERFGFGPAQLTDYKGLRGDPSDNIIGIAGIGEKTATILITAFGTVEGIYAALEKDPNLVKKAGVSDRIIELLEKGKEEALFSKMLATIRRDAPISFTLPENSWKEGFDINAVETLFKELEFRTLVARLKIISGQETKSGAAAANVSVKASAKKAEGDIDDDGFVVEGGSKNKAVNKPEIHIDPILAEKLKIGVHILNSTIVNPSLEDVFAATRTENPELAEKRVIDDIHKEKLETVYFDIELPLIPILQKMHELGVKIDVMFLKDLGREYHKKLSEIEKKIWEHAGTEFNVASPKQLGEIIYEKMGLGGKKIKKTAGGVKSTKESELEKLKGEHPVIGLILEYRELAKLLGTYIDVLPTLADANDRVHTQFIQTGAATGRMSSQNPGLQNIPIKTEQGRAIRNAFISDDGYTLVSFDYSQIELRIAAFLSGDEKLIEIFKSGTDVHTGVAASVFGVDEKDVTKDMRRRAKVINFGILYGMGVNALKTNLGSTRDEAQKFYDEYFKNFSGLAAYLDNTKAEAARLGYTETFFGRRRYFEGIHSRLPFIRAAAERMAINAPIQGTQADLIKISMRRIDDRLREEGLLEKARLLLQVHDELIYEIRTPEVKRVATIVKSVMEGVLTSEQTKGVPIQTSANAGKNWGNMEAIEF